MNREAVALGVPVYTTFQGRMGGVDEKLLREGRLRRLERAGDVELERRDRSAPRLRRDPQLIVDLILGALWSAPRYASGSSSRRSSFSTEFTSIEASAASCAPPGTAAAAPAPPRPGTSRSSQASSTPRGRITGMRSCTGATTPFAVVVMIVHERSARRSRDRASSSTGPAKPNGAPSSSV